MDNFFGPIDGTRSFQVVADYKRLVATSAASRHASIYLISAMDLIVYASF